MKKIFWTVVCCYFTSLAIFWQFNIFFLIQTLTGFFLSEYYAFQEPFEVFWSICVYVFVLRTLSFFYRVGRMPDLSYACKI